MDPLTIRSGQGDYRVEFVPDLAKLVGELLQIDDAVVMADRQVAARHGGALGPLLASRQVYLVDATEDEKTLDGARRLLDFLQQAGATRRTTVIVIGGGIVQDIAAFATRVYYRGIRWVFAPTTLLAMADSCIGAKSGLNLNGFKNQIGMFNAPSRVLIALPFLETLADADVASGYGEILKLALTGSRRQYEELAAAVDRDGFRGPALGGLIRDSLRVKQGVIEQDEYEADLRRILNYGHTFGHALETASGYEIPHGLAVAWGVDLANHVARSRGLLAESDYQDIHAFIGRHFRVKLRREVPVAELIQGARRDKKVASGKLVLILLAAPGELRITPLDFDARLEAEVAGYLARDSVVRGA